MKIRQGFVSNSSSSSFVLCLPSKPSKDIIEENKTNIIAHSEFQFFCDMYETEDTEVVLQKMTELLNVIRTGITAYDDTTWGITSLARILKRYVVAKFETGPESGAVCAIDYEKIKKIVGE